MLFRSLPSLAISDSYVADFLLRAEHRQRWQWWGPWRASLVTSVLFGLWHIAPTLGTMSDNHEFRGAAASVAGQVLLVLGAIAVTFAAGLAFCWLRLKSRSLIAPVMAHAATNGLALTVAWFAVHHASLLVGR